MHEALLELLPCHDPEHCRQTWIWIWQSFSSCAHDDALCHELWNSEQCQHKYACVTGINVCRTRRSPSATAYSIINVSASFCLLQICTIDEWAANTFACVCLCVCVCVCVRACVRACVCVCEREMVGIFAELNNLFCKWQSETHVYFLTIQKRLQILGGCVIFDLIVPF